MSAQVEAPLAPLSAQTRWRARVPDVVVVLVAYLLTRVWVAVAIVRASQQQEASIWTGARSGYFDLAGLWDGQWYRTIAEHGYPVPLPLNAEGVVQQNAWAFFPGFPYTAKTVMTVTGLPFSQAAVLANVVLGGCAVYVMMRLLQRVAGRTAGLWATVLFCAVPSGVSLQIAYSESLGLLLLVLALWWLVEQRYLLASVAVLLLALSRPVAAPFGLVVLAHLIFRWRARAQRPFPTSQRLQVVGLGLLTAVSSLLWPAVVAWCTNVPDAYQRTQGTWRSEGQVQPLKQSLRVVHILWGDRGPWYLALGALVLVLVVLSPLGRRMGPELQTWSLAYPAYLLVVTEPWTSTFRYLLLEFPLLLLALSPRPRILRVVAVLGLLMLGLFWQVRWVEDLLVFHPPSSWPP